MPLMDSAFFADLSNLAVWTKFICLVDDYSTQGTFLKNFCHNICSEIEIKTYFHFSHYKSMEIICCHSDGSTRATAIKTIFVEAIVMNISTKFQLHSLHGFWGEDFWIFFFFFANLAFWLLWQPIKFRDLDKIHVVGRGPLKEHFCETFVKISVKR